MRRRLLMAALWLALASPALAVGPDTTTLDQEPDYRAGMAAIRAEDFAKALSHFHTLQPLHPWSPEIANWLGFSYRKLKRYPESKRWYDHALLLDANYLPALEYQGEWFIETGDIASARANLARLEQLCGRCHEWQDLNESLAKVGAR